MICQNTKNAAIRITATIVVIGFIITQTGLGTAFALREKNAGEQEAAATGLGKDI